MSCGSSFFSSSLPASAVVVSAGFSSFFSPSSPGGFSVDLRKLRAAQTSGSEKNADGNLEPHHLLVSSSERTQRLGRGLGLNTKVPFSGLLFHAHLVRTESSSLCCIHQLTPTFNIRLTLAARKNTCTQKWRAASCWLPPPWLPARNAGSNLGCSKQPQQLAEISRDKAMAECTWPN